MKLTYDWPGPTEPPAPGDVLVCLRKRDREPTGTCYLIVTARRVKRREPVPGEVRMAYGVERVLPGGDPWARVEALVWNSR